MHTPRRRREGRDADVEPSDAPPARTPRRRAAAAAAAPADGATARAAPRKASLLRDELPAVVLLVVLYMLQGVPLGLSMGSMPFLMQAKMSYTKIGIFSLASYPYSFKLLWSPIVDSVYWPSVGRRRSWILPLQALSALLMLSCGDWAEAQLNAGNAGGVTALFFVFVLLAATQDIAVDGWALTLLSKQHVGYAATCQTVGMNLGYFSSFTVFLALNDASFANKYLPGLSAPGEGAVTLRGYLRFWGWAYLAITAAVALFTRERPAGSRSSAAAANGAAGSNGAAAANGHKAANGAAATPRRSARIATATPGKAAPPATEGQRRGRQQPAAAAGAGSGGGSSSMGGDSDEEVPPLREAYLQLWRVVRLPAVQLLALVLVTARLGMLTAEAAAPLKLLEKGVSKEALAGLVLAEFPMELLSALVAGRWAAASHPFDPWLTGYRARLGLAALSTYIVFRFPAGAAALGDAPWHFAGVALVGVATSFTSTLMFTSLGSFFNKISDPSMGGAYLTLLNTVANLGVTLPKLLIFAAMDWLTQWDCAGASGAALSAACSAGGRGAAAAGASNACTAAGGRCAMLRDGFYLLSGMGVCLGLGIMLLLRRVLPRLEAAPLSSWHARAGSKQHLA